MDKSGEVEIKNDGDDILSSWDLQLWNFTYEVLMKFNCPIIFKILRPDFRTKSDLIVSFLVPNGREDVANYIITEFEHEVRITDNSDEKEWFFSTRIMVHYFSGIEKYMEYKDVAEMANAAITYLIEKLKNKNTTVTLENCIGDKSKIN